MRVLAPPPKNEAELLERARGLAGRTFASIAAAHSLPVPQRSQQAKGWTGVVLEAVLGATATSHALPDFPAIGVEMKGLPIDPTGRVRESTYVATAPLDGTLERSWEDAWVRRKLARVLWVPILVTPGQSPGDRRVGNAFLWSPSEQEDAVLRADWEEIAEHIALGRLSQLHARHGRALQVRPKAASASSRTWVFDEDARLVRDIPRGFYLRPSFTRGILASALRPPGA